MSTEDKLILRAGEALEIPGLQVVNFLQEPELRLSPKHFRRSSDWIYNFVIHTFNGEWPQRVVDDPFELSLAYAVANYWRTATDDQGRPAPKSGTQLILVDDVLFQLGRNPNRGLLDIGTWHSHCPAMDEHGFGIELAQLGKSSDWAINRPTMSGIAVAVPWLCVQTGIQMQTHQLDANNYRHVSRFRSQSGPTIGWFFHSMTTGMRGRGDAGDHFWEAIVENTPTEVFDFSRDEDRDTWRPRQKDLGVYADGIPGPKTTLAAEANGFPHGIWALGSSQADPESPEALTPVGAELAGVGVPSWRQYMCDLFCLDHSVVKESE